jgi:NADH:ubiquinone oxidoreductase subunit C
MFSSDFLEKKYRFSSIYNLLSYRYNHRIFLNTIVEESMIIDSTTAIYPNIMWYERESWDFYGILYSTNNDLRRILNDYGFKGFPLRKDFPLSGFLEVKYDYLKKSIAYEPVKLVQEFRYFDTKVP